MEHM